MYRHFFMTVIAKKEAEKPPKHQEHAMQRINKKVKNENYHLLTINTIHAQSSPVQSYTLEIQFVH
jgi:hypothetical protein